MTNLIDIYHGSPNLIEHPVFGEGKTHNDYGLGFYCTEHAELDALKWTPHRGYFKGHTDLTSSSSFSLGKAQASLALLSLGRRSTDYTDYACRWQAGLPHEKAT